MAFADFQALYKQKLTTADEAVKVIKSGDWVDYGFCAIHPRVLDEALARRAPELEDVKVRGGISLWKPAIFDIEDPVHHIIFNSHHMSSVERHHIASGAGFHEPMRYSELPRYYYDHITPPDVAMFQVAPMDKHGYFNFGLSASHVKAVCEMAKVVIVEVNENMPRCLGGFDNCIHVSEVDMIVEGRNDPMGIQPSGTATEVDRAVAKLIVEQIPDGACLQLGIGGMPNTVGAMLCESDLKDLGVHTEMYVDAYVDLAMAGKVTCMKKNIDRGRQVFAFAAGTQKLYDYLDDNPACMAAPISYTNDIRTIAAIDNFVSINNAVDVDLYGQVNGETAGTKQISGAGGQQDFVLGAYLSKGGKLSLIQGRHAAFPHTAYPAERFRGDGYPREHHVRGDGVRLRVPEGTDGVGARGEADLHRAPGLPGGTDPRGGEAEDLVSPQQKITNNEKERREALFLHERGGIRASYGKKEARI